MTMKEKMTNLLGLREQSVASAKAALAAILGEREHIIALRRKRDAIAMGLPARAELQENVRRICADLTAYFLREQGRGLLLSVAGQTGFQELNGRLTGRVARPSVPWAPSTSLPVAAQAAIFPAAFETGLWAVLEQVLAQSGEEPGLPAAERAAALEALDREIAEREQGDERATDEMAAAGLAIAPRPDVVARRAAEARVAEEAARKKAEAAWLEAERAAGRLGTPVVSNPNHFMATRRGA
jgi:hypothetical protein